MPSDIDHALWALEEEVERVVLFVKGSAYGLRLAAKRVADVASGGAPAPSSPEMARLAEALAEGEDRLSDVTLLALGDHFRAFLARALGLPSLPPLPADVAEMEALPGTPGALGKASFWVPLALQLYRVILRGGKLDRRALDALGTDELEIAYPGGKVKLFREGDRVGLSERQLEEVAHALVEAGRAIRFRLLTS